MKMFQALAAAAISLSAFTVAHAQEKVTFLTSWRAQTEHGGFYQALAKGYYKACGVDMTIRQGGPGIDPAQLLTGGAVDFIMASHIDSILHMNAAGFPARAFMTAFQTSPQMLMAHPDSGINSFEDMKGRGVMISQGSRATFWPFLRKKYGWQDTQLRSYSGQLAQWLSDKTLVQQGFVTNEPFLVKQQAGWEPRVFMLSDAGFRTYGSILVGSQPLIDKKPAVVQCVVTASARGWDDFMKNDPKPALEAIKKEAPNNTDALMANSLQMMKEKKLVLNEDTDKWGVGIMTMERFKAHHDLLRDVELLKSDLNLNEILRVDFLTKPAK